MFDHIPLVLAQDKKAGDEPPVPDKSTVSKTGDTKAGDTGTTAPADGSKQQPQQRPSSPFGGPFLFIILGVFLLFIIMSGRRSSRDRKKREAMLGGLKKGDRIQTIGGALGAVVEVRDNKVVIKIDESNNTRMQFARSAIQTVFPEGESAPKEESR